MSLVKVKISDRYDSVGYKPFLEESDVNLKRQTAFAVAGDEVEMPAAEKDRLADLGAIEGEDADPAAVGAPAPEITKPDQKAVDEPSIDEGRAGAPQFAGTPKDKEILDDPQTASAGTADLALSDLKVKDGSLHAEAERLGLDVDDDETASSLRSRIAEAREQQSSDES